MNYYLEHDWVGLIHIKDGAGTTIETLTKHATGSPGASERWHLPV